MTGRWASSNRRNELPPNWQSIKAQVKQRASGRCEAYWTPGRTTNTGQHHRDCDGIGTDTDHIQRGNNHSLSNLQLLSTACHKAKTQQEAQEARPTRERPQPPHPGRLT